MYGTFGGAAAAHGRHNAWHSLLFCLPLVTSCQAAAVAMSSPASAAASGTSPAFGAIRASAFQGRIVATPLPDRLTFASSNNNGMRQLPPNKAFQQQIPIDSGFPPLSPNLHATLNSLQPDSTQSDTERASTKSDMNNAAGFDESFAQYGPCSVIKLDVYVYGDSEAETAGGAAIEDDAAVQPSSSFQVVLNRNSNELVGDTLQRIVLNLSKKFQSLHKKRMNGLPGTTGKKGQMPSSPTSESAAPQVWLLGPPEPNDKGRICDSAFATAPQPPLLEQVNTTTMTNSAIWNLAATSALAVTLPLPSLPIEERQSSSSAAAPLASTVTSPCFWVDSCPPTITAVRTFEDFGDSYLFVGVPIVVQIDTLYATHCRVDWYVDNVLYQTTFDRDDHCYTPIDDHVDKQVAILITPFRGASTSGTWQPHNGLGCQQAYRFQRKVDPVPVNTLLQIRSTWLHQTASMRKDGNGIRVVTYNILAHQNAFQSNQMPFYPYVTKEVLSKERRLPLILHEILAYQADVLCLQEVDESVFSTLLEPVLTSRRFNYQGYYSGKKSDGREGCALFWSLDKFELVATVDQKTFAFRDLVKSINDNDDNDDNEWKVRMQDISQLLERRADLKRVCTTHLGHIFQMVPLQRRRNGHCADDQAMVRSGAHPLFWVANTHLFFHPRASHIRLLQMYLMSRQLGRELQIRPGQVIFCGDFNSSLQNSAGKLMLDRCVPCNFRDNKVHLNSFSWENETDEDGPRQDFNDDFPEVSLPESFPSLVSAVDPTPLFTHLIGGFQGTGFQGTLDHIMISQQLVCSSSAPMPSLEDVTVATAMPSANLPSDHVSLVCDLSLAEDC